MQPLGRATETAALGDGDEGVEEIEVEHLIMIVNRDRKYQISFPHSMRRPHSPVRIDRSIHDRLTRRSAMSENPGGTATHRGDHPARLRSLCNAGTKICPPERAAVLPEAIIAPGDRVTIEGDNQKQADLLAAALANVDPMRVHDLHMVQSVLALPDHLSVFGRTFLFRDDRHRSRHASERLGACLCGSAGAGCGRGLHGVGQDISDATGIRRDCLRRR
jgi:hypothetical protein